MTMTSFQDYLLSIVTVGGCGSHITGVATGLLGVYLRWAVHLMYSPKVTKVPSQDNSQHKHYHHMFFEEDDATSTTLSQRHRS